MVREPGEPLSQALVALADDLTGALEVGAKFASEGIEAAVVTGLESRPAPALVIDTETRHLTASEAAGRVRAASSGGRLIYKKTDSTLRGNIGAELGALLEAHPDSPLIYAPAYPAMGRVVKGGHLFIDGIPAHETAFARDALNPVTDGDILRVLRSGTEAPVFSANPDQLENLRPGAIYVCDGESGADIERAAQALAGPCRLAAGPAAFAEAIARRISTHRERRQRWPRIRACLVINGSRHERSLAQICHAEEHGWRLAGADAIREPEWRILPGAAVGSGPMVLDVLKRIRLEALVIFGGDTAYGILQAFGAPALWPLGEVIPGVPISRVEGLDMYWITKAGGFGPVDALTAIRGALA